MINGAVSRKGDKGAVSMYLVRKGFIDKLKECDDIRVYKEEILDYFFQLKRINLYSQELAQFCI